MSTPPRGRPFLAGQSGNPSGRPKGAAGLPNLIGKATRDGREIWEFFVSVMRGEIGSHPIVLNGQVLLGKDDQPLMAPAALKERLDAAKWLANRKWGKETEAPPAEPAEESGDDAPPADILKLLQQPQSEDAQ